MKYEDTGTSSGPPLILVPGGLSGWASWKPHAEILSKNHRVVRVQLVNMAAAEEGTEPPKGYNLRMETEYLENTLKKLGIAKIHLVGWSHGGEVSLDFALNNPSKIATLTLIEPAVYWVLRAHNVETEGSRRFVDFVMSIRSPVTEDSLTKFLRFNGLVPPGAEPKQLPRWPLWNSLKIALLSVHTVIEHDDKISRLRLLERVPKLLVKGKGSVGENPMMVDLLKSDMGSRVQLLVLPDAHASHIVAQDQFIAELEKFIKGVN